MQNIIIKLNLIWDWVIMHKSVISNDSFFKRFALSDGSLNEVKWCFIKLFIKWCIVKQFVVDWCVVEWCVVQQGVFKWWYIKCGVVKCCLIKRC